MTQIEKIRAEIERRRTEIERRLYANKPGDMMRLDELDEVLSIFDTLEAEKPEGLDEAAIDFADNARKSLFTKDYAVSSIADYDHGCIDGFKAGAEWMAGQGVSMIINDDTEWEEVDSFIHKNVDGDSIIQIRKK